MTGPRKVESPIAQMLVNQVFGIGDSVDISEGGVFTFRSTTGAVELKVNVDAFAPTLSVELACAAILATNIAQKVSPDTAKRDQTVIGIERREATLRAQSAPTDVVDGDAE